ncbi:MAG: lipopolysaccharide biosynthesis protein, partial [Acidimicrobiales bacterium]
MGRWASSPSPRLTVGPGGYLVDAVSSVGDITTGDTGHLPIDERAVSEKARRGFTWSLANSLVRRVWTFALGLLLARLLAPADFGVYAMALTTLTVLQSMNELGTTVALVRWQGDPSRAARTATTIAISVSVGLYAFVFALAPALAGFFETPEAATVIRILTVAVVFDGMCGVPNALLERAFLQRKRVVADFSAVAVNAAVSVGLAVAGLGPLALAWGIVAGNLVGALLIIWLSPSRPRPAFHRDDARRLLEVGLPLAGASLLVFLMLNVEYVFIGGALDAEALGFYVLAFNISSWPSNLLTAAIRSVSIPAFALLVGDPGRLRTRFIEIFRLVMIFALPASGLLAVLAHRVVEVLYGTTWLASGGVLMVLASVGVARVALDLCYDLLVAMGRSRTVMWLQALWVGALVPVLVMGTRGQGIRGAALAHLLVVAVVMVPAYAVVLRRVGIPLPRLARTLRRPLAAAAIMGIVVYALDRAMSGGLVGLLVAAVAGAVMYAALVVPWHGGRPEFRSLARPIRETDSPTADGDGAGPGVPPALTP